MEKKAQYWQSFADVTAASAKRGKKKEEKRLSSALFAISAHESKSMSAVTMRALPSKSTLPQSLARKSIDVCCSPWRASKLSNSEEQILHLI